MTDHRMIDSKHFGQIIEFFRSEIWTNQKKITLYEGILVTNLYCEY